jgi:hypothetical protein
MFQPMANQSCAVVQRVPQSPHVLAPPDQHRPMICECASQDVECSIQSLLKENKYDKIIEVEKNRKGF